MKRQEFIAFVVSTAVAWPFAARAQQSPMPMIGWLSSGSPRTFAKFLKSFQQGLRDQEIVEGQSVTMSPSRTRLAASPLFVAVTAKWRSSRLR